MVTKDNDIYKMLTKIADIIKLIWISFSGFLNSSANGQIISNPEKAKNINEKIENTGFSPYGVNGLKLFKSTWNIETDEIIITILMINITIIELIFDEILIPLIFKHIEVNSIKADINIKCEKDKGNT